LIERYTPIRASVIAQYLSIDAHHFGDLNEMVVHALAAVETRGDFSHAFAIAILCFSGVIALQPLFFS
jgi:hypothetical protein